MEEFHVDGVRTEPVHPAELDVLNPYDASVMPYVPNGNIYAPVMMTAEKTADLVLGNTPLEPIKIPFHRSGPSAAPGS